MQPLAPQAITILRYAAQTFGTDGRPLAQTPSEIAATASVQPADMAMTCTDPGYSGQQRRMFYTLTACYAADEAAGIPADRIEWDGNGNTRLAGTWMVWAAPDWPANGGIPRHWEVEAYLVQPLNPPVGTPPEPP
jgi:hypothetical protein